ncbi:MAG: SIR2 family protein [bacterium]
MYRENDVIILLGAGCSVDAGIPASKQMISLLEDLLETNNDWQKYQKLYNFVKSAILYSDGIKGKFDNNFDIERLVNVLSELEKKENSTLYPFIGSWNTRLQEVADSEFVIIRELRQKILQRLNKWVSLEDYSKANYYNKFYDFQTAYNYALRIFSLNYDLCFEKNIPKSKDKTDLERGFDPTTRNWDWRRFEPKGEYEPSFYLYKLHGSIDWERDEEQGNILKEVDNIPDIPDLIFGTDYKMQYIDPYLFYAYAFRQYSLESKLILTIGYSYRDEHINGILEQALSNRNERKVIIVSPDAQIIKKGFCQNHKTDPQITALEENAEGFLNTLTIEKLKEILEKDILD